MDDLSSVLQGTELTADDPAASGSSAGPDVLRGFANPEVLERAQATRRANREANAPTDLVSDGTAPRASGKAGRPKKAERNLEGVQKMLCAIHFMIATATGYSDLAIEPAEGMMLAEALATLADHYKIKLDGKSGAVMGLIYAAGTIYGPRAVTIGIKLRAAKQNNGSNPVS